MDLRLLFTVSRVVTEVQKIASASMMLWHIGRMVAADRRKPQRRFSGRQNNNPPRGRTPW
jgi:hypothetical protein